MKKLLGKEIFLFFGSLIALPVAHASCYVSIGSFGFGQYNVFDTISRDSIGVIDVNCQEDIPQTVNLSFGPSNSTGYIIQRAMRGTTGDLLYYNLFLDSARNIVAGDGISGGTVVTVSKVSRHRPGQVVIYSRIPAGQDVSIGNYTDRLTVGSRVIIFPVEAGRCSVQGM